MFNARFLQNANYMLILLQSQLEAQGHTVIEPSEFFSEASSSLLIIIKNEDIAEHICEVTDEML